MKQKKVWILSGAPGSGKSSFVKSQLKENDIWVSRDEIRFKIVPETDKYFSKETVVIKTFGEQINEAIENPEAENVYIDATHLSTMARGRTIKTIEHKEYVEELNCVHIDTPLKECLRRNELRAGRAMVPAEGVIRMYNLFCTPIATEGFDHYYVVNHETNEIKEVTII